MSNSWASIALLLAAFAVGALVGRLRRRRPALDLPPARRMARPRAAPAKGPQDPPPPPAGIARGVAVLLVLGLCACAMTGWQGSLARCGLLMAPAGATDGVALALRGGEGWQESLARLVLSYGECVVKAEVQRHAEGLGPEPPSAQVHALTTDHPGELAARPMAVVTRETAQGRARLALAGWGDVVRPRPEAPR